MLLSLSDKLAQVGDWLAIHFAELGGAISIPVVVWFLAKLILSFVKNKQAIKSAVLDSVKTLNNGINILKAEISEFKKEVSLQLEELENNMESKIDNKFNELREKRKEIYNNIMSGIDTLETTTQKTVENVEEKIEEVTQEIVQQIDEIPEVEEKLETEISVDDILR